MFIVFTEATYLMTDEPPYPTPHHYRYDKVCPRESFLCGRTPRKVQGRMY